MKGSVKACDGATIHYDTADTSKNVYGMPNYWYVPEGHTLVLLNEDAKQTHSLMIKQWCWKQGWNTVSGDGVNTFRIAPDPRYTNRALGFIFEDPDKALIFKMRWG